MQKIIQPTQGVIDGEIQLPSSKLISIYTILLAAMSDGVCEINQLFIDDDVADLIKTLHHLGIAIQFDDIEHACMIAGCQGQLPAKKNSLSLGKNHLINYHLLCFLALSQGSYHIDAQSPFKQQYLGEFLHILRCLGAKTIPEAAQQLPFSLGGCITSPPGGEILIESHLNENMITALLFSAAFAQNQINFILPEKNNYQAAIQLACEMMNEFGVFASMVHPTFVRVHAPQAYHAKQFLVEADLNLACFILAAAASTGGHLQLCFHHLLESKQQGYKMTHFLTRMGCDIEETVNGITLSTEKQLKGIDINLHRFDEIFYALVGLAPFCQTPSYINHIGHHNKQERQHFEDCKKLLRQMNIQFESGTTWLKIYPSRPQSTQIDARQHPMLALTCHIIGLKSPGMVIHSCEFIAQMYPGFYPMWKQLEQSFTRVC